MKKETDLGERIRLWYSSYDTCPPWSSIYGFILRELKKEKQKWEQKYAKRNIQKNRKT